MLHILQVTDCHLSEDPSATLLCVGCHDSLCAVLEAACVERTPDAALATGDIAQAPFPQTYRLFLSTLRRFCDEPLLCVPGNHDFGAPFAAELPTADLELGPWWLLGVDTHEDDRVGGTVAEGELQRLRDSQHDGPTLVAGTHVNSLCSGLLDALREYCEFRDLLPKGLKIAAEDIWEHCAYVLSAKLAEPQFSGQTKERLSSWQSGAFIAGAAKDAFSLRAAAAAAFTVSTRCTSIARS